MKIAFVLEYDGSQYQGWQRQAGAPTVQACLEDALSKVADQRVRVHCAGRTDSGVHAYGQVAHIETQAKRKRRSWVFGANANLPRDISVVWAGEVEDDFHARFSAIRRTYRYLIFNRSSRGAIFRNHAAWECRTLDHSRMQEGAAHLLGTHDFSAFRAQSCQAKNPVRTLSQLSVTRFGSFISILVEANAFLHHMVRNIAGVLMAIGMGKAPPGWVLEVLLSHDRTLGGVTAPPQGLYLMQVKYPPQYNILETGISTTDLFSITRLDN
ncbi:MAG: tRNA pseudouridine(38-40) synthase TruA [Gammaproteobacteria bacterium]